MFSYVSPERRVPADHPLRAVREMVDAILKEMSGRLARLYAKVGRPSIAPERLLRALLLQIFYSLRSERLLMEQLDYNLLFRWFVGMENRNGLLVRTMVTQADGTAERDAALLMAWKMTGKMPGTRRLTLGGDKNYDTSDFVSTVRELQIVPHVAQNNTHRSSAIDERTTRHAGYQISQQKRKRAEQSFGCMKTIGLLRKVKLRGIEKVGWWFTFVAAAYNLWRLQKLRPSEAAA